MAPLTVDNPEEQPLLRKSSDVYDRFSPSHKFTILTLVSGCGLLPFFVTGTFTPSIPAIAADLNSTGSVVNLAVSLSVLAASLGGLIGASYSTFYGRRPVYLFGLPLLSISSFGVAAAQSIPSLLFWRFLQSVGSAPALIIGAGVIGDIYRLEERGRGMGMFFAACLVGPAIAPFIGGSVAHYASWRTMQASIGVAAILVFTIFWLLFPETSHPGKRGVDKMRATLAETEGESGKPGCTVKKEKFVWINPFASVALLRSPPLLIIATATTTSLYSCFVLLIPLAYTIGERYHLSNSSLVGACFLPAGIGNMLGAFLVGRLSDHAVTHHRSLRPANPLTGIKPWYPEDRLLASLWGFAVIVPTALMGFAATNAWVQNDKVGLGMEEVWLFMHGIGADISFGPCAGYLVDVMQSRSAESLAANNSLRSILIALGTSLILPSIDKYGILFTNAISAVLCIASWGLLIYLIRNGDYLRGLHDVGFPKQADTVSAET